VLTLPTSVRIYLATEPVDMRRGHDGLGAIVRNQWKLDLFSGHLFCFVGRRRNRIKILFWSQGGFVLFYKRLERGCFRLPKVDAGAAKVKLDATQLGMLLDGIDLARVRRPRHWQPAADRTMSDMDDMDTPIFAARSKGDRHAGPAMIKAPRWRPTITAAHGAMKPSGSRRSSSSFRPR
jgi:transposase